MEKKRIIPKGDPRKPRYWRVNVGKKLTGTKKERRFFESEADAKAFIRDLESSKKEKEHSAFSISGKLASEAVALNERLAPLGVSLTTAVEFYLRNAPQGTKKTVSARLYPKSGGVGEHVAEVFEDGSRRFLLVGVVG